MAQKNRKTPKQKRKYKTVNSVPGTVTYVGEKKSLKTVVDIVNYNKNLCDFNTSNKVEDAFDFKGKEHVTWININGLYNTTEIEKLGKHYNLHPLVLEDIVTTNQRAKIEEYEDYLFIVFKMLHFKDDEEIVYEHMSLVVGENYLLTFQEADGDVFDDLRDRIRNSKGRIRNARADYLMYAILDAVVDNYFTVIEAEGDKIEDLEERLFLQETSTNEITSDIQKQKREILKIRRTVFPFREVVNKLEKSEWKYIDPRTNNYLRNLYDHMIQVNESIDLYREMIWGLMDLYMTNISNKMNEVMKVLTIIATIFIPLTFIAGIYGMNFENMPELHYEHGYIIVWAIMIIILIIMLIYFRKKKWI
ncbi:magnesium/cobalt transporter CorA [Oceanihabitans sediminis]|uniref:Magnesium transport protein CorA n=2 Tax=Pseudomonadati TaxID=3379134 RepID=A0A368P3G3_9FLAO|nr:magnesium/cobalt transporter CorA [Oceanihabitans sediminis]MDX1277219.1 magnesium/cobalt transporter CorA [Oceanihabitans sediminis]MDX1773638.1 magnesium/cobalt transporter CorA [Oceanihabitans sediminis]RBP33081.1 magnesium transporter [Oceanihabitans sediminis]RCU57407.1 magnesium and cobalt transport protein CorA [Oceanihabitans sediminis]